MLQMQRKLSFFFREWENHDNLLNSIVAIASIDCGPLWAYGYMVIGRQNARVSIASLIKVLFQNSLCPEINM